MRAKVTVAERVTVLFLGLSIVSYTGEYGILIILGTLRGHGSCGWSDYSRGATTHMKSPNSSILALATGIIGSLLISGCYTQLAITSDEPEETAASEPTSIYQPAPTAIAFESAIIFPVTIQNYPSPVAITSSPGPVAQPQSTSGYRETGNQRSAPSSTSRTGGSTRSAR